MSRVFLSLFIGIFVTLLIVCSASSVFAEGVEPELQDCIDRCTTPSLVTLNGKTIRGRLTYYKPDGTVLRSMPVYGSFRGPQTWLVRAGFNDGESPLTGCDWIGASVQNGKLSFNVRCLAGGEAVMASYGFGSDYARDHLYGAQTYVPLMTTGSHCEDYPFAWYAVQDGFTSERMETEDSPDRGRCWGWSVPKSYTFSSGGGGKVWFKDFADGTTLISKLEVSWGGSRANPATVVTNQFAEAVPPYINRVVYENNGAKSVFEIDSIEPENEGVNGFTPEAFGLETPVDPDRNRVILIVIAVLSGSLFVFITYRYMVKK